MFEVDRCPECGVPLPFTQSQAWLNDGDIVQRANPSIRMAFIESENLDPLIRNVEDIIGMSIEHMIINIATRSNEIYLRQLIPREVKDQIRAKQIELMPFIEDITLMAQLFGFGKYELLGFRYARDASDHSLHRITEPFSVYMAAGSYAGAVSAVVGEEIAVFYKLVSPGVEQVSRPHTG
jgi:predicted house-cleaning noncanonical NTP pyrophosphatase (MazG superfamily)